MVYRRSGLRHYYVAVPTRTGSCKRSTGTADKGTAKLIAGMLHDLGPQGKRAWDLLDAVRDNRLELGSLYDAWRWNDLDGLRARLEDPDLSGHVAGWLAWLTDRVRPDCVDRYLVHARTLIPESQPFRRSGLAGPAVAQWLALRPVSGPTKRRYLAAVQSFATYLVDIGVLPSNPLRDVKAPPANPPRCEFLELPDVLRVVEGAAPPFRALFALAYGAGIELGAILTLVESDIEPDRREVRARGTKAWTRDRIARVADWAWPIVEARWRSALPGERLFRGLSPHEAGEHHRERLRTLGLPHHRLHDSRHHWAVRMVRAGMPLELVARQLGHRDVVMVAKVYGRFVPTSQERDRWEAIAAALDAEKWGRRGALQGAPNEKALEPESPSADADDATLDLGEHLAGNPNAGRGFG